MNILYYYPIYLPTYSGEGGVNMKMFFAFLIVFNVIGIVLFIIALLINKFNNAKTGFKSSLKDTIFDYVWLGFGMFVTLVVDIIAIIVSSASWIAGML